jgi:hypothetical protein
MAKYLFTNDKVVYSLLKKQDYESCEWGTKVPGAKPVSDENPDGFAGTWVWDTAEEANNFRYRYLQVLCPTWRPEDFAVFELELLNGKIFDVQARSKNDLWAHTVVDVIVGRKVLD